MVFCVIGIHYNTKNSVRIALRCRILCSVIGKFSKLPYNTKTLREDRTAAEWEYIAYATRRRRRILYHRILCPDKIPITRYIFVI